MKIEKNFELKHPREFVWSKFGDVTFVAQCVPGASVVSDLGNNRYKARMAVKVGPMAAAFDGEIAVETDKQAWTGIVSGKGSDLRSSSRASGSLVYRLSDGATAGSTRVDIESDYSLAGPLAQFSKGSIIQEIASRITAAFVTNFEARLSETTAASGVSDAPTPEVLDAGNLLWTVLCGRLRTFWRGLFGRS